MEKITRRLKVERNHGDHTFTQNVDYSTFSTVTDHYMSFYIDKTNEEKLKNYLGKTFLFGVPEEKKDLPSISSAPQILTKQRLVKHAITTHAERSNYQGQEKFQHATVARYLMDNDPNCIATEIPVWNGTYRGHIDILRIIDGDIIELLDFKPKAKNEKKAASQVVRYVHALSERTKIPLSSFRGYYFDHLHCYQVSLLL